MATESEIFEATKNRKFSHSSLSKGYVSRKIAGEIRPYSGKFGNGVIILKPNYKSCRYCIAEYWIDA